MRFRLGLFIGFGTGYYLGAKAGQQRYDQLRSWVDSVRASEAVGTAQEKAKAAVDLGRERAREVVEQRTGDDASGGAGEVPVVEIDATGNGSTP